MAVVTCSSCTARFKIKDEMLGRTAKCPKCATSIALVDENAVQSAPARDARRAPKKKSAPPQRRPRRAELEEPSERPDPALWTTPVLGLRIVRWAVAAQLISIVAMPCFGVIFGVAGRHLLSELLFRLVPAALVLAGVTHLVGQIFCCFSPAIGPKRLALFSVLSVVMIPVLQVALVAVVFLMGAMGRAMEDPVAVMGAGGLVILGFIFLLVACQVAALVLWLLYLGKVARTFRDPLLASSFLTLMIVGFVVAFTLFVTLLLPVGGFEKGVLFFVISICSTLGLLCWYYRLLIALDRSIHRRRYTDEMPTRDDNPFAREPAESEAADETADEPAAESAGGDNPFSFG